MTNYDNLPDSIIANILDYDNRFIVRNGIIKDVVKLPLKDERYGILENIFKFNKIEEKVYDDYENEGSYIVRFSLSENKNYSIIYDSLNDSRYVHFLEFFREGLRLPNNNYVSHRSCILIEDY